MWDEFRGHDPKPNEEEREWLQSRPLRPLMRTLIFIAFAAVFAWAVAAPPEQGATAPILATAKPVQAR